MNKRVLLSVCLLLVRVDLAFEPARVKGFRGSWMRFEQQQFLTEEFTQRCHLKRADSDSRLVMSAYWVVFDVFGSSLTRLL